MSFRSEPLKGVYSAPIRLFWAGWETDTLRLQQAGWQLSVEQHVRTDMMRIYMKHEGMQMQALTDTFGFRYRTAVQDFEGAYVSGLRIPVQAMARHITFNIVGSVDWSVARPVDAMPQMRERELRSMEDLVHFAPLLTRTHEVLLTDAEVPDMLAEILKRQDPDRQARLKAKLRDDRTGQQVTFAPRQKVHAQIISIAA
jgi:hypothetical protein